MNISKRKKTFARTVTPTPRRLAVFIDELHSFVPSGAIDENRRHFSSDKPPAFIATQAIITRNSGKRIRFISTMKRANGEPLRPAKQKFLPAQCLRRQANDAGTN